MFVNSSIKAYNMRMSNLYIVSTPIGNLQDITLRAAKTLFKVDFIVTESTSKTANLLEYIRNNFPSISPPGQSPSGAAPKLVSYSEDEEEGKLPHIFALLEQGDIALVSEAGTPLISDPGFKLVREAVKRGVNVISIPGASSPITALTTSGLPTDKFFFVGYLPKKAGKKVELLNNLKDIHNKLSTTFIIFESPHRLVESLKDLKNVFGDVDIVVTRELTKIHEEIRRETVEESIQHFNKNLPKGEFILLI